MYIYSKRLNLVESFNALFGVTIASSIMPGVENKGELPFFLRGLFGYLR